MKKLTGWFMAVVLLLSLTNVNVKAEPIGRPTLNLYEQNTMSVLWYQKSGEAKALYYQGYNIGKMRLDEILSKQPKNNGLKPAIVLDIDETILDNSPHLAWFVLKGKGKPFNWSEWFNRAEALPLPGAVEFLKYADSKGVVIYYISNRKEAQKEATLKNLQSIGAPQVDTDHVLLRQPSENGKETRRMEVAKTHEIVLLFGDNLGDFSGFDKLSVSERNQAVENSEEEFGKKLIVFPNPMYGDWEGAIYHYDYRKSDKEKAKLRKKYLETYQR
ncbi:5'-nucleotidase, lipoprotein e(P4) family [Neobacillus sp. WH10]|uniref:5'-nucleotidase, lipoprotein e(P4) family n=1 Tax=Neobacillus sp. WH10 TaxID=3047873 RepID=UPI0024C147CF|nr:5'-nucleotidase, lipoprotein e(P4) family [Neobacillus sp. WH10]WHY78849.1 5'-nucleotidase, lipoprotein e(P4) family [Neobacillus sp. WH10]